MMGWSRFSPEEIERRRLESVEALKVMERERFDEWYRVRCDADYWTFGQRCSGCDFWASEQGDLGECQHAGIVSGVDVLLSMGVSHSTFLPEPGYPMRRAWEWCANFKDDFDWSLLDDDYLQKIGAMRGGVMREKPQHKAPA